MINVLTYVLALIVVAAITLFHLGIFTVINYFVINFILDTFNVAYHLTWLQACAVALGCWFIRWIFRRSNKEVD